MFDSSEHEFQNRYFESIGLGIASDEVIREKWSRGEIKKPETINYRTFKPEKGGLFCEKIFGPTKDWECSCGKYKKIKHKGIICDRCGVEVTVSKVRRNRMAHIELAVPVVHIWFFKTQPSRIGNLLGISIGDLERVIYYEVYIVVDSGQTDLEKKQLLSEIEYREAQEKWGIHSFSALMGGEAIKVLLQQENFPLCVAELKEKLKKTKSFQARMKVAKRLKIIEGFVKSNNRPEWMVISSVPVIPPDLRPLVPLDASGRFASSDLNDLYRRAINRSNRLKAIMRLQTPEVIIRNEKRMLQESIDALFDNGRHGHPVMGAGNRPLKSISDMLKGKQGRFRQNLLGKRVDYSGRSVIVVGPELKMNQCGLPKKMALELFEPFIVKNLKDADRLYTIRAARKMIQKASPQVWDVLEEVIRGHPVLLNRAPTLHRLGVQAFEPVLIEGKAIQIHPLVCSAYNADFDGDQMAIHIPLSIEAQIEAKGLMMAPDNIFLPSSGKPIAIPSKDILLGLYYLMIDPDSVIDNKDKKERSTKKMKVYSSMDEVLLALNASISRRDEKVEEGGRRQNLGRGLHLHEKILVDIDGSLIETTPGRVIFNQIVPKELGYQNYNLRKSTLSDLVLRIYKTVGLEKTVVFLDQAKDLGFAQATKSGLSMGVADIMVPPMKKKVIEEANKKIQFVSSQYEEGVITEGERKSKVIAIWTGVTEFLSDVLYERTRDFLINEELNPLFLMIDSGARGSKSQLRQLGALRGLMAKPSGDIIEHPILANFREGLSELEYFISSHGARKGLADTALKTADSGYLTRRLVDVSQDVLINEDDCHTLNGIEVKPIRQGGEEILPLKDRIFGRQVCEDIHLPGDKTKLLAKAGDILTMEQAAAIDDSGTKRAKIRSPLTCETEYGICKACYGIDLATGSPIAKGSPVGIIAAQALGEQGTQLVLRTFHTGGTASGMTSPELKAVVAGVLIYQDVRVVWDEEEKVWIVLNKNGFLHILKDEGKIDLQEYKKLLFQKSIEPLQSFPTESGAKIFFKEGQKILVGQTVIVFEQYSQPIICERSGYVKYEDLLEGISVQKSINAQTGQKDVIIKHHKVMELQPQIIVYSDSTYSDVIGSYPLPPGAILSVEDGAFIQAGKQMARIPKGEKKVQDITGGLPRLAELFEARKPKESAEIAKIDGIVHFHGIQKHRRLLIVCDEETGMKEEHLISLSKHLIVQNGDRVEKGQPLTGGMVKPHEILEICGPRVLCEYLVDRVIEVYRMQGVDIKDVHVEVIIRQMLRKYRITDPGDTVFLYGEDVEKRDFHLQNKIVIEEGGRPAQAVPSLHGITKSSLNVNSPLSAASFQEPEKVLTCAACESRRDYLIDFKSNIITGQKVPSGTGYLRYCERLNRNMEREREDCWDYDFNQENDERTWLAPFVYEFFILEQSDNSRQATHTFYE